LFVASRCSRAANAKGDKGALVEGWRVLIGYARVSRGDEQSNAAQVAALRRAECERREEE